MSKPKKIAPVDCGPFAFGVNSDAVAKALCPKLSGVNPALVDLLYGIEWFKDRVKQADAAIKQKQSIPEHLRKVSQKIVPVLSGQVIEVGKLDDAPWPESVHAISKGARVIEVDELDDAIEARDIGRQTLNLKMAEFNDLCERALTRGESEVFLQIAEIVNALKAPPLSFLVLQAWLPGQGESKAGEIREQVNEWLKQDGREREIIHSGNESTIRDALNRLGLPYPDGKNKKSGTD